MSEFNFSIPGGESRRLKTGGKYCPADIVVTAEGGSAPAGDWSDPDYVYAVTRPKDWLPMPTPGDDEMYLLNLIPEGLDGCFTAQITFKGECTVEFGNLVDSVFVAKERITPTSNTRFFHTLYWDNYGDTTSDGYRQYFVRIKGDCSSIALGQQGGVFSYGVAMLVDAIIGMTTNLSTGATSTSFENNQSLRYIRYVGNGRDVFGFAKFRCIKNLISVSMENKMTGANMNYSFSNSQSLLAVSENVFADNAEYNYAFHCGRPDLLKDKHIRGITSASGFMRESVYGGSIDLQHIDTSRAENFDMFAYNCSLSGIYNLNISSATSVTSIFKSTRLMALTFAGETTPGGWTIDCSSCVMSHKALVNMINSLPTALSPATITITGNPGASELTEDEIAVATAKNWTVTI